MNEIIIRRKHGKTPADARAAVEQMANKLKAAFDLDYAWEKEELPDGPRDLLRFKRPGVAGDFTLDREEVALRVQLGGLLAALKPAIERKVTQFFDEQFAGEAAR